MSHIGIALVASLIGCTRLRAVSGILRTQRGRRGSGLGRLRAGTAFAGLARRSRAGPPSTKLQLSRPHPCGQASRPCGSTLRCVASRPCGSTLRRIASRPCGSTQAGVGQCPLAIGHGCLVGPLAGVLDRQPVSPLSSSPACSGAGLGWHGRRRIADSTMYLGGLATGGAGPLLCANSWAATVWRIASVARLRRSRAHRAERGWPVRLGTTVVALSAKLASCPSRARWGSVMHGPGSSRQPASGMLTTQPANGLLTTQPASGLLTIGRRRRRPAPFADSDAGPGCRIARRSRPEVRLCHGPISRLPPCSHLLDHDRLTRTGRHPGPCPLIRVPAAGVNSRLKTLHSASAPSLCI
jgi:hypothetical protein